MLRKFCLLFALIICVWFLSACDAGNVPAPPTPEGTYAVDPIFREFYNFLGGMDTLGPAISPVYLKDQVSYQYTDAALMVYDPLASADERFSLAPLGLEMGISGWSDTQPAEPERSENEGPEIYPDFVTLYNRLGGEHFVGKPITEVLYNPEKRRYEQFFEKLGFYWLEDDHVTNVRLLAYGAWKCDLNCRSIAPLNSIIELPKRTRQKVLRKGEEKIDSGSAEASGEEIFSNSNSFTYIPYISKSQVTQTFYFPIMASGIPARAAFSQASARLAAGFTGLPLSGPFQTSEGRLEQIYENVVLVADLEDPERISLLALPRQLGLKPSELEPASTDPVMTFYAVEGEQGYNIPAYFLHYLQLNGGLAVSGSPMTQFEQLSDHLYRQCFTNLCLEEERNGTEGLRIRLAPIGYSYKTLFYPSLPGVSQATPSTREVVLQIWERDSLLSANEQQEIGVQVTEDGAPLVSVEPVLILSLPDGGQNTYTLPPTGPDGQTRLLLAPVDAPNGSLIPYQVCISRMTGERYCVKDDFLIWEGPQ